MRVKYVSNKVVSSESAYSRTWNGLKGLESTGVKGVVSPERVQFLERENAGLNKRLATARERTQQMIDRVRFLRQQHDGAPAR